MKLIRSEFSSAISWLIVLWSIPQIIIFLWKARLRLGKKTYCCVSSQISLGMQQVCYDSLSRLYNPGELLIIEFLHKPRNNYYLSENYCEAIDFIRWSGILVPERFSVTRRIAFLVQVSLKLILAFDHKRYVIDPYQITKMLTQTTEKLKTRGHDNNALENYIDYTGYNFLITGTGRCTQPAKHIKKIYADLKSISRLKSYSKICVLLLRGKGVSGNSYIDSIRDAGPHSNYRKCIEYLGSEGYAVFALGETDDDEFAMLDNYIPIHSCSEFGPIGRIEIALLTQCDLMICQHSGPPIICDSNNVPVLLCDSMPLWQGRFGKKSLILAKQIWYHNTKLKIKEVLKNKEVVAGLEVPGVDIRPNSEQEILNATKLMIRVIKSPEYYGKLRSEAECFAGPELSCFLNHYLKTPIINDIIDSMHN